MKIADITETQEFALVGQSMVSILHFNSWNNTEDIVGNIHLTKNHDETNEAFGKREQTYLTTVNGQFKMEVTKTINSEFEIKFDGSFNIFIGENIIVFEENSNTDNKVIY